MQAIVTKYLEPTNHRGSRVRATCAAGTLVVGWDNELGVDDNHAAAALALCRRLGWTGALAGGSLPDGTGDVFVFTTRKGPLKVRRL